MRRETYYLLKKREPNTYVGETTIWGGYRGAYSRNTSKALPCYADKNLQPIED